jgi:hypothetical protein
MPYAATVYAIGWRLSVICAPPCPESFAYREARP